jgi:hypothetical protein
MYCVSKTMSCAGEYSGRAGPRIYTQCLVLSPDLLARFANNPFAVLRAAVAQGTIHRTDEVPRELNAIRLVGRCGPVDHGLLTELIHDPGAEWLVGGLAEMQSKQQWAIATSAAQAPRLIAGLLNCLPIACRAEISFTTGLRLSPRRPFRIACLPPDPAEIRRVERQHGPVFTIAGQHLTSESIGRGWVGYVAQVLESGRTSSLVSGLAQAPKDLRLNELETWGQRMYDQLGADVGTADHEPTDATTRAVATFPLEVDADASDQGADAHFPRLAQTPLREPEVDSRDHKNVLLAEPRAVLIPESPASDAAQQRRPETLELLDQLDDAVFEAIDCRVGAIEQLRNVWPVASQKIQEQVLDESREHYVRQALCAWRKAREQQQPNIDSARAAAVLDVLCVVLDT